MALNPSPVGPEIADYFINNAPAPGTPVGKPQLEAIWQGAINILYNDVKENADVHPAGSPATGGSGLENAAAIPGEVTSGPGAGGSTVTTASEPIVGTGSIQ